MKTQTLYRMFDASGELLYVGITQQQVVRFYQHAREKSWWPKVARIETSHFPDRAAVERAEQAAIATEDPRYNIVGKSRAVPKSTPLRALSGGRGEVWRPEALECTLIRRQGGRTFTSPLVLQWELNYDTITDHYRYSEADEWELFQEWVNLSRKKGEPDAMRVYWYVSGPNVSEFAEPCDLYPNGPHFEKYYILADCASAYRLPVSALPVADRRWTPRQMDKGGFIQQATQYKPAPLQSHISRDLLISCYRARRP